jgi:hypothetical protein
MSGVLPYRPGRARAHASARSPAPDQLQRQARQTPRLTDPHSQHSRPPALQRTVRAIPPVQADREAEVDALGRSRDCRLRAPAASMFPRQRDLATRWPLHWPWSRRNVSSAARWTARHGAASAATPSHLGKQVDLVPAELGPPGERGLRQAHVVADGAHGLDDVADARPDTMARSLTALTSRCPA